MKSSPSLNRPSKSWSDESECSYTLNNKNVDAEVNESQEPLFWWPLEGNKPIENLMYAYKGAFRLDGLSDR